MSSLDEMREWRRTRYESWPTDGVMISIADLDLLLAIADERDALSTPPADDVREALAKRLADEIEYRVRTAVALAKGGHSIAAQVTDGRASVPVILAQFEVRPRGTVTDAEVEWEYGVRHVAVDGWPTDRVRSSLDAARADLDTCGMNCHLIRRRSAQEAGQWEAFHASCEVGS